MDVFHVVVAVEHQLHALGLDIRAHIQRAAVHQHIPGHHRQGIRHIQGVAIQIQVEADAQVACKGQVPLHRSWISMAL